MLSIAGRRFLKPIKASLDAITPCYSSSYHSAYPFYGRCGALKTLVKDLEPVLHKHVSRFHHKLNIQRTHLKNLYPPGRKLSMGSIFGLGAVYGLINVSPHFAHAMDGHDILAGEYHVDPSLEEGPHTFWMVVKKFWVPLLLFTVVLVNWKHPIKLVVNVIFFIFTTKPRPYSVYLAIEQLRHESMRERPYFHKFKPLYAKKVEVKDCKLFCLARVVLRDEEFNLVGILGSWWILPSFPAIPLFLGMSN